MRFGLFIVSGPFWGAGTGRGETEFADSIKKSFRTYRLMFNNLKGNLCRNQLFLTVSGDTRTLGGRGHSGDVPESLRNFPAMFGNLGATHGLRMTAEAISEELKLSESGVIRAAQRGEQLVQASGWRLVR